MDPDVNWTHASLLARCGQADVTNGIGNRLAETLRKLPRDVFEEWDSHVQKLYGITIEELQDLYNLKWTFDDYHLSREIVQQKTFPDHILDFFVPITLKNLEPHWCPAIRDQSGTYDPWGVGQGKKRSRISARDP